MDAVQRSGARIAWRDGRGLEPERRRRGGHVSPRRAHWCASSAPPCSRVALDAALHRSGGAPRRRAASAQRPRLAGRSFNVALTASWEPDLWGRLRRAVRVRAPTPRPARPTSPRHVFRPRPSWPPTTSAARVRRPDGDLADDRRRLRARAADHAEPIRRRHRRQDRRAAGADAAGDRPARARRRDRAARAARARDRGAGWQGARRLPLPPAPTGPRRCRRSRSACRRRCCSAGPTSPSAERPVAAANAQIGIQRSAYFPSFSLRAPTASAARRVGDLFNASTPLVDRRCRWRRPCSMPARRGPASRRAEAARDAAVAHYRQTVLTAFQSVEDQLTTTRVAGASRTAAPQGLRGRRPDRAAAAQPLPRRPGRLHRRRHRAGLGPDARGARWCSSQQPPGERDRVDPGPRRRLDHRPRTSRARFAPTADAGAPAPPASVSKHLRAGQPGGPQNPRSPQRASDGKDLAEAIPRRRAGRDRREPVRRRWSPCSTTAFAATPTAWPTSSWASRSASPGRRGLDVRSPPGCSRRGWCKGDRVAVMMPNVPQYPVAIAAILRAGLRRRQRQPALHAARARAPAQGLRRQADRRPRELRAACWRR